MHTTHTHHTHRAHGHACRRKEKESLLLPPQPPGAAAPYIPALFPRPSLPPQPNPSVTSRTPPRCPPFPRKPTAPCAARRARPRYALCTAATSTHSLPQEAEEKKMCLLVFIRASPPHHPTHTNPIPTVPAPGHAHAAGQAQHVGRGGRGQQPPTVDQQPAPPRDHPNAATPRDPQSLRRRFPAPRRPCPGRRRTCCRRRRRRRRRRRKAQEQQQ